ncbi:DNA mismatch repair ATPase msh1 [Lunasporangiospora selenospora]|uniref:DNA mismatch repair ATPase msh1 n=1 Tax=Lunasporangiospora selenospora TaxID=979761 RepID=A0A9P6G3Y3_9FUNG|nr:DNA mismatch repair ATPase msh1 [Lunasporangiospora selenospora]
MQRPSHHSTWNALRIIACVHPSLTPKHQCFHRGWRRLAPLGDWSTLNRPLAPFATKFGSTYFFHSNPVHSSKSLTSQTIPQVFKEPLLQKARAAKKKPKSSVLTLDDLQSVNPKPAVLLGSSSHPLVETPKECESSDTPILDTSNPDPTTKKKTTPLRKQIIELEATHPDCVLLIRVGEFYELYDHNAVECGHLLGLKIATKVFGSESVPFTGFPIRQLDRHLETLVGKHSLKVALCEQFHDGVRGNSRTFRRSVHRIITPGTLIDEQFLDQTENNWLLAVASDRSSRLLGLSWLDLSTGDFFTQETTYDSFPNDLARIRPREIILNSYLKDQPDHTILQTIQSAGSYLVSYEDMRSAAQMALLSKHSILEDSETLFDFDPQYLEPFTNREQSACLSILRYVNHTQMGRRPVVQGPIEWQDSSIVKIDKNTIEALELVRTLRDSSRTGSLLYHLDKTKTRAGSRLLAEWLTSPLTNSDKINDRLDMVKFLTEDSHLRTDLEGYLKRCRDAQRSIQKLSLGLTDPQDLISIRLTLEAQQYIKACMLNNIYLMDSQETRDRAVPQVAKNIVTGLKGLEHTCELIQKVVDDSMESSQGYGFINEGVSPHLNGLHVKLRDLKRKKKELLDQWTTHLGGAKPFEIKSSYGYRHVVELRNTVAAERLRSLLEEQVVDVSHAEQKRTKIRYQVPTFSRLMESIERTESDIILEEKSILQATRSEILEESAAIIQNCRFIAELDVLLAFANITVERHYVRPVLNQSLKSDVINGRHPVVELALQSEGRHFMENSCTVGENEQIWLLTGPNMGGKSTFLRQNAIITIMAQVGCFVPAFAANLGIVDKVFSRLGSTDNLANSQSTFMVEMIETACILQHATERSLVIMDEVGRGTATLDGCAIAYATLHHLYHINKCRTLFATHYHELADMVGAISGKFSRSPSRTTHSALQSYEVSDSTQVEDTFVRTGVLKAWKGKKPLENVKCYQTTIEQQEDGMYTYMHHVIPGVCRQSHGIHVAKLAGMPQSAIDVSTRVLEVLQGKDS